MYYKNGRITNNLPNKLELNGKVIFNPKWHHYEADGWKEFPSELEAVQRRFIKWVNGDPVEMTQEEKDAILNDNFEIAKLSKIETLWQAATAYEHSYVANGAYAALLEAKLAGSTKATDFGNWISSIWTEYYSRRDSVTAAQTQEAIDLVSDDFTSVGPPPYSIREVLFGT